MASPWDGEVRRIETIDDVTLILSSPQASVAELMDCVSVAEEADRWDLQQESAERAFAQVIGSNNPQPLAIKDALDVLVKARLHGASSLAELPGTLESLRSSLGIASRRFNQHPVLERFAVTDRDLSELLLLLVQSDPGSDLRLSSKLRKVKRSDLAVEAASRALEGGANAAHALTTRGAAYGDLREFEKALEDLERAFGLDSESHHAATAVSKVHQRAGRREDSLHWAMRAVELCAVEPIVESDLRAAARRLIDIAVAVDDSLNIERARELLIRVGEGNGDSVGDVWVDLHVADILIREGRLDEASELIDKVKPGSSGELAKKVSQLGRRLKAAHLKAQPRLDLDGDSPE